MITLDNVPDTHTYRDLTLAMLDLWLTNPKRVVHVSLEPFGNKLGYREWGCRIVTLFDNGYGVSVVQHSASYGGTSGEFELAVIKFDPAHWETQSIVYDTPITADVVGYLSPASVMDFTREVMGLEERKGWNESNQG